MRMRAWVLTFLLFLSGCSDDPEKTGLIPACGPDGVARVELGRPWGEPARFTTTGGELYATAYGFRHGHFGDSEVGTTRLYVGEGAPKDFDAVRNRPSNALVNFRVVENDFTRFELPAGSYWLISTNYAEIAIVSCDNNGVSNAVPGPS